MNKAKKIMMLAACAVLLVCISVGATLAYLTDTDAVTNTFTLGQVGLSLDEADTDDSTPNKERDTANKYHLMPGGQYDKDPTVHVDANSEACWLFVKVENGIAPIEAAASYKKADNTTATGTIAEQMVVFGWTKLTGVEGVDNVYYQKHATKSANVADYVVFKNFKISGDVTNQPLTTNDGEEQIITNALMYLPTYDVAEIKVTAYAIQLTGFENDPAAAWVAGKWN